MKLGCLAVIALIIMFLSSPSFAEDRLKVIMLGDSLTALYNWQPKLPKVKVYNQGVSGESTGHVLARLDEVVKVQPDLIFLQIGINDFGRNPLPEAILKRHMKIWHELKEKLPNAKLYIVSLLPVSAKRYPRWGKYIIELNSMLQKEAENSGLPFLDIYSQMADQGGSLNKDFTNDGLHLKAAAYDSWISTVKPYIDEALATH